MQPLFFNPVEHDQNDYDYHHPTKVDHLVMTLADLPPCEEIFGLHENLNEADDVAVNRASRYFQALILRLNLDHQSSPVVILPSACELTSHLHCSEIHIFEALQTLLAEQYEFEIRGIDGPICIRDPHHHKRKGPFGDANHDAIRTENPWQAFAKQFHLE
jgi:hypothetical protein